MPDEASRPHDRRMDFQNWPPPPPQPRRRWTAAGIAIAVTLAVCGLLVVAGIVFTVTALNSIGGNK